MSVRSTGPEGKAGPNVALGERRILLEEIIHGRAVGKLPEDETTQMRVPHTVGFPKHRFGSTVIRSSSSSVDTWHLRWAGAALVVTLIGLVIGQPLPLEADRCAREVVRTEGKCSALVIAGVLGYYRP